MLGMPLKGFFRVQLFNNKTSVSLLLLRLVFGLAFIIHGGYKMAAPTHWMEGRKIVLPAFIQLFASCCEFFGGVLILIGFLTPIASCLIFLAMSGALWYHIVLKGDPFIHPKGKSSFELASVYFFISILYFLQGPGKYSVDYKLFGSK